MSDLGVPAPYGRPPRRIAPMRVYHRRGRLIGESQERVARAKLRGMWGCPIPLLLARVRLITLCEVRNTAGPSHHDLVNGSLLMKSTKYEGRNCLSLPFGLVRQPLAREGARSKTTQGEGMRSSSSCMWHR